MLCEILNALIMMWHRGFRFGFWGYLKVLELSGLSPSPLLPALLKSLFWALNPFLLWASALQPSLTRHTYGGELHNDGLSVTPPQANRPVGIRCVNVLESKDRVSKVRRISLSSFLHLAL